MKIRDQYQENIFLGYQNHKYGSLTSAQYVNFCACNYVFAWFKSSLYTGIPENYTSNFFLHIVTFLFYLSYSSVLAQEIFLFHLVSLCITLEIWIVMQHETLFFFFFKTIKCLQWLHWLDSTLLVQRLFGFSASMIQWF